MFRVNIEQRLVQPVKDQPRVESMERSIQIEKLISMNEQANQRSEGLETAIRNIGFMPAHAAHGLQSSAIESP